MKLTLADLFDQIEAEEAPAIKAQEPTVNPGTEVLEKKAETTLETSTGEDDFEEESGSNLSMADIEALESVTITTKPKAPKKSAFEDDDFGESAEDFLATSGLQRFRLVPDITKKWMKYHVFTLVRAVEMVRKIVDKCISAKYCSLDVETEGLDTRLIVDPVTGKLRTVHQIVGYCLSYDGVEGFYIPVRHELQEGVDPNVPVEGVEREIKRLCEASIPTPLNGTEKSDPLSYPDCKPNLVIAFWNAIFDQEMLYPVCGIDWWHPDSFEDGMLARYCDYSDDYISLKETAKNRLKDPEGNPYEMIELKELFHGKKKAIKFAKLAPDEPSVVRYGGSDGIATYLLCHPKRDIVMDARKKYGFTYRLEKQVTETLRTVERNKMYINRDIILPLIEKQTADSANALKKIQDYAKTAVGLEGLEPSSPKQLAEFLFGDGPMSLNLTPKPDKTETGQFKTDSDTLEALAESPKAPKILKDIVEYRKAEKFTGTYLFGLRDNPDKNGEIRIQLKQTGTASGRFSAPQGEVDQGYSGIPMHGIPGGSEVRRAFEARSGYSMCKLDYAAQELRIVTNVSGETVWEKEFLEGSGDLHRITAAAFFKKDLKDITKEERQAGKCVHPDTLIGTPRGLLPIRELGLFPEDPDTFADGFYGQIATETGYRNVKALYNGGIKPLCHVVTTTGVVTCTAEHRFLLTNGNLVRTGDLKTGDLIVSAEPFLPFSSLKVTDSALIEAYFDGVGFEKTLRVPEWVLGSRETAEQYIKGVFNTSNWFSDLIFVGQLAAVLSGLGRLFHIEPYQTGAHIYFAEHLLQDGEVLAIRPAGEHLCLDVTIDHIRHLYVANGLVCHNTANFALVYGGGPQAIMRATGCDKQTGIERKEAFDKALPRFAKWVAQQKAIVKKQLGVRNAFNRWLAIPDANHPEGKIRAACERHAINYPIQSAGADIMKIAMVLLHKRFHKEGWLKNGGDDSVRILISVHDELVFEVRHDRVAQAIPIMVDIMESPWKIAKWKVPLVVEPLIGFNWKSGFGCRRYEPGMKAHPTEILINGFLYDTVREPKTKGGKAVESLDKFEYETEIDGKPRFAIKEEDAPWILEGVKKYGRGSILEESAPLTSSAETQEEETHEQETSALPEEPYLPEWSEFFEDDALQLMLVNLEERVLEQVMESILYCEEPEGTDLILKDMMGGVLIERGKFRVDPDKLYLLMSEYNLIKRAG